jgi:hypothetical protein
MHFWKNELNFVGTVGFMCYPVMVHPVIHFVCIHKTQEQKCYSHVSYRVNIEEPNVNTLLGIKKAGRQFKYTYLGLKVIESKDSHAR